MMMSASSQLVVYDRGWLAPGLGLHPVPRVGKDTIRIALPGQCVGAHDDQLPCGLRRPSHRRRNVGPHRPGHLPQEHVDQQQEDDLEQVDEECRHT